MVTLLPAGTDTPCYWCCKSHKLLHPARKLGVPLGLLWYCQPIIISCTFALLSSFLLSCARCFWKHVSSSCAGGMASPVLCWGGGHAPAALRGSPLHPEGFPWAWWGLVSLHACSCTLSLWLEVKAEGGGLESCCIAVFKHMVSGKQSTSNAYWGTSAWKSAGLGSNPKLVVVYPVGHHLCCSSEA